MEHRRLLLLSNSRNAEGEYLVHALPAIRAFLGPAVRSLAFVPWAGVTVSPDEYTARVRRAFGTAYEIHPVPDSPDAEAVLLEAGAIVVGGGNTFHLLRRLYDAGLVNAIRSRVQRGVPYVGWSAGSVITGPTIATTNDMPISEPPAFRALALQPLHINAHFTEFHPPGHQGETRAQRIEEFLALHQDERVIGLREGAILRIEGETARLVGDAGARLFRAGAEPAELSADAGVALSPG